MQVSEFDPQMISAPAPLAMSPKGGPIGLLLTGGGARAAYQAGVLEGVAEVRRTAGVREVGSPFAIVTGTSAGAINAAAIASHADDFDHATRCLAGIWRRVRPEEVYRAGALPLSENGGGWRTAFSVARWLRHWRKRQPRSLLDNSPLAESLRRDVPLERLPMLMAAGYLQALAISASNYSSGEHYTFYQSSRRTSPWQRTQRVAVPTRITHEHLLASSAIPFVFPASGIAMPDGHVEYFGDGSMRQTVPLADAVHLGSERILAIGSHRMTEPQGALNPNALAGYPTLAQVAGHVMSSVFLDALSSDVERMQHINHALAHVPPAILAEMDIRPVELLVICPSERVDVIASRHTSALPSALQRMLGCSHESTKRETAQASALASYLLFDSGFTQELMALGRADALRQRDAIQAFFGWGRDVPIPSSREMEPGRATGG